MDTQNGTIEKKKRPWHTPIAYILRGSAAGIDKENWGGAIEELKGLDDTEFTPELSISNGVRAMVAQS